MVTASVAVVVNPLMKLEYEDPVCWPSSFQAWTYLRLLMAAK
jgi:hypothetical protein